MTDDEFKEWFKNFDRLGEDARIKNEIYRKEIVDGLLKIPLEGFTSNEAKFVIADDLEVEKVSPEEREKFFERAATIDLSNYKTENNHYFVTFQFKSERQHVGGLGTGDRIMMIAIYFALSGNQLIKINKAQSFGRVRKELESLGIARIPNGPSFYTTDANFTDNDIRDLKKYWPLFRDQYTKQPLFALIARRYYFSLIRNQWEDKLIDMIIALEALLVPEDTSNIGGLMAKRLSKLLLKHYERSTVTPIVKECYQIRNKVVHGEVIVSSDNVHACTAALKEFVKLALQIYLLEYSMFTHSDFIQKINSIEGKR